MKSSVDIKRTIKSVCQGFIFETNTSINRRRIQRQLKDRLKEVIDGTYKVIITNTEGSNILTGSVYWKKPKKMFNVIDFTIIPKIK